MARPLSNAACALLALLLAGCARHAELPVYELSGNTMGTTFTVKLVDPGATVDRDELGGEISARLEDIEQRFSTYRPASELSLFNDTLSTEWIPASAELCSVVESALAISRRTNGAFDVTIGPLVLLWGFGPDGERTTPPDDETIAEARSGVGYDKVETDCSVPAVRKANPGVYIDLSAFVKGYAVDEVDRLLVDRGIDDYLVEIGGELRVAGLNASRQPWAIAVEKPDFASRSVQSIVRVTDRSVATSGDYRNFFEHEGVRYSHTIDPATGRPVTHGAAAVTVIGATSAEADALATALLVMGPDDGMRFARDADIAAYFLLRAESGIEARLSPEFEALLN